MKVIFISLAEASATLGIAVKTARNWLSAGKFPLPTYRLGGKRVVRVDDIESFISTFCGVPSVLTVDVQHTATKRGGRPRKQ